MKTVSFKTTFNSIFQEWMTDAVSDIKKEAVRLVSGPLLKIASGLLASSFHTAVEDNGHAGYVWNDAPYAVLWEEEGIQYKAQGLKRQVIKIVKRGATSNRSQMGTIFRSVNYNKTKNKPATHFMWTAVKTEMAGQRGQRRYEVLGYEVGYALARRYITSLTRKYEAEGLDVTENWNLS